MIAKALLAAALVAGNNPSSLLDEPPIRYNAITRDDCAGGSGTAFWIGETTLVTAAHVMSAGDCTVDGTPLVATSTSGDLDIAIVQGPRKPNYLRIRCRGYREGQVYHSVGYAGGTFRHTARLLATREVYNLDNGNRLRILLGQIYPGMSGGPVFDSRGRVVGINNRGGPTFSASRSLSDTEVCR